MAILIYFVFINILAFSLYGADKWKAKRGNWRVSESTLLLFALLGGSVGALLAMRIFRHKTKHKKFTIGVPAICILQLSLLLWLFYVKLNYTF